MTTISNIIRAFGGILLISLFISPLSSVQALQLGKTSIDEMFKDAVIVAVVQIKATRRVEYKIATGIINCGFDYEAKILKPFKGGTTKVKFRSHDNLVETRSYLMFFNSIYHDGDIRFLAMGRNDVASYEKCKENSPGLYVSDFFGEIFELDGPDNVLSKLATGKEWVVMRSTRIKIPPQIKTKFMSFKGPEIPEEYADYYSHTLILRDDLYQYLERLQAAQ